MLSINQLDFPISQYFGTETPKNQIVLHHTASPWNSIVGDVDWWKRTVERVATHFIIGFDGRIHQLFSLEHYAYHMNLATLGNTIPKEYRTFEYSTKINKQSVGIELDAAGALTFRNGQYRPWYEGQKIEAIDVCKLSKPHRGTSYFHRYSDAQILSLENLLQHLVLTLGIDVQKRTDWKSIFELNESAYTGKSGIYTHNSYQLNKNDAYPDPRLLQMLSNNFK